MQNKTAPSFVKYDTLAYDSLRNGTYYFDDVFDTVKLDSGYYDLPRDGEMERDPYYVQFSKCVWGDLDGDGNSDAIVVLQAMEGGTGFFNYLFPVLNRHGRAHPLPGLEIGDRIDILSIKIRNRIVIVDLITQGPNDPRCCPTQEVVWRFRFDGSKLVKLK